MISEQVYCFFDSKSTIWVSVGLKWVSLFEFGISDSLKWYSLFWFQMYYDKWWKNHNHNLDEEERVTLAGCPRKSQTLDQVKKLSWKLQKRANSFSFSKPCEIKLETKEKKQNVFVLNWFVISGAKLQSNDRYLAWIAVPIWQWKSLDYEVFSDLTSLLNFIGIIFPWLGIEPRVISRMVRFGRPPSHLFTHTKVLILPQRETFGHSSKTHFIYLRLQNPSIGSSGQSMIVSYYST